MIKWYTVIIMAYTLISFVKGKKLTTERFRYQDHSSLGPVRYKVQTVSVKKSQLSSG